MSKVAIVTDSTAYLPPELIQQYPITVVPLQVIWGPETLRDGIDIQPSEFYTRLKDAKDMPTTSQPSPAAFIEVYTRLMEEGYDILSIHISSKLSGTLDSATQARFNFPSAKISLFDSEKTSLAMGFQVLQAARAAVDGATLEECTALVEGSRPNTGVMFAVNTLEFLRRGGRIGGGAAFLGTMLDLKPILELREGRIEAVERVRTMSKATDRLLDLFEQRIGSKRPIHIGCVHANAPAEAQLLLERARNRFGEGEIADLLVSPVSPVVGVHTGPGVMGLAFMAG